MPTSSRPVISRGYSLLLIPSASRGIIALHAGFASDTAHSLPFLSEFMLELMLVRSRIAAITRVITDIQVAMVISWVASKIGQSSITVAFRQI